MTDFTGNFKNDSQEFFEFLLDGLHEDLNRVRNPPYIKKADVNHENNLSVAGAEAWDAHCKRNQCILRVVTDRKQMNQYNYIHRY